MRKAITIFLALTLVSAAAAYAASPSSARTAKRYAVPTRHAKISEESAQATASAQVPGGKIKSHELENEHGKLIYSFDFEVPGKTGIDEVNVDAMNGKVIAVAHEGVKAERQEKLQEKREAKSTKSAH